MEEWNTRNRSSVFFWYLRDLRISDKLDPPNQFPYYHEWRWTDTQGKTTVGALAPSTIVHAGGTNYYTSSEKNLVTRALAPLDQSQPAQEYPLGTHLTAIATYRSRLYLLDLEERAIHVVRLSPEWRHDETLPLPASATIGPGTRLAIWSHEHNLRALLWDPKKRGYDYLVADPEAGVLHRRQRSLCWPGQDPSQVQIGDAIVDTYTTQKDKEIVRREYLYVSEVRIGSIHALDLVALEDKRDDNPAVLLVRGGTGLLRFGEPNESSLVTPISLAVFRFSSEHRPFLRKAFGGAEGPGVARQRFLVCVDSESKCVVTVGLRPKSRVMLPLIGSGEVIPSDRTNLIHTPARFTTVVRGQGDSLLFGVAGTLSWRALRPWIPGEGDVARARTGGHS